MSPQALPINCTIDPCLYLEIVQNSDGTITRNPNRYPSTSPTPDPSSLYPVLSQDIPINQSNKTWARIFLPGKALEDLPTKKLPLVVYFHGGGFIHCSAASTIFHEFCVNMAVEIQVVIISVDYRLTPEHRLPAAYDDAVEALQWIKLAQDDWLAKYADLSNCFIMGSSAGGNLAYHAGLRAADSTLDHLKIRGLILHHPFFGGTQRTESELRLINDPSLPASVNDLMWYLSLPIGVDRDHEYCNPTFGGGSKLLGKIKWLKWRVLVTGFDGDPLIDRQTEVVELMKEKGLQVMSHFDVGGCHLLELKEPSKAKQLFVVMKNFIFSVSE